MYYLARKICISKSETLFMQVVEVVENRVVRISPFESEKASMLFVDMLLLSDKKLPSIVQNLEEVLADTPSELSVAALYVVEMCDKGFSILPVVGVSD